MKIIHRLAVIVFLVAAFIFVICDPHNFHAKTTSLVVALIAAGVWGAMAVLDDD